MNISKEINPQKFVENNAYYKEKAVANSSLPSIKQSSAIEIIDEDNRNSKLELNSQQSEKMQLKIDNKASLLRR